MGELTGVERGIATLYHLIQSSSSSAPLAGRPNPAPSLHTRIVPARAGSRSHSLGP
jgi:hypothetical protein